MAKDAGAGLYAGASAAEFVGFAGFVFAGVVEAFSVDANFSVGARCGLGAFGVDAFSFDAEVVGGAVTVAFACIGRHTLTVLAHLFGVGALYAGAGVVDAGVAFAADAAVFADACSGRAPVFFAGSVDALFTRFAGFVGAGVGDTLTPLAFFIAGTLYAAAGLGTAAVGDTTELCCRAGVVGLAWVACTLGAQAYEVAAGASGLCGIAASGCASAINADFLTCAVDVDLAGGASNALACNALLGLGVGAFHFGAGVIDAAGFQANAAVATGGRTAGILLAAWAAWVAFVAILAGFAGTFAGGVDAGSILALFASRAANIVAGANAGSVAGAANLTRAALCGIAGVGVACAVFAEVFVARAFGCLGCAPWRCAKVLGALANTDLIGVAVSVDLALLQHLNFKFLCGAGVGFVAHFDFDFDLFAGVAFGWLPR